MKNGQGFGTASDDETNDVIGALAVQAIRSPNLESRITVTDDSRKFKFPDVSTSAEVAQFVGDKVAEVYAERYKDALKIKRTEEEAERCKNLIKALVATATIEEFVTMLSNDSVTPDSAAPVSIRDRSAPGYPKLVEALMASPEAEVPERLMKLWVLILGRNANGEAVWSSGNVFRGDYKPFAELFIASGVDGKALWEKLLDIKKSFGTHVYRASGIPNRTGHSNEFPSWWARGYTSPDQFKALDPVGFADYVKERVKRTHRKTTWMVKLATG